MLKKNQVATIASTAHAYPTYVVGLGATAKGLVAVHRADVEKRAYVSSEEELTPEMAEALQIQSPKSTLTAQRVAFLISEPLISDKDQMQGRFREIAPMQPAAYLPEASRLPKLDMVLYSPSTRVGGEKAGQRTPVRVLQVVHGGAFCVVSTNLAYTSAEYEAGAITRNSLAVFHWSQLYKQAEPGTVSLSAQMRPEHMRLDYYKMTFMGLVSMLTSSHVVDNQKYQRQYVWTVQDKQKFISSLLHGRDVGKFVFVLSNDSYTLEVLDGKQRCSAIMAYLGGHFPVDGVYHDQLDQISMRTLLGLQLNVAQVTEKQLTEAQKMELFLDINDTGVPQSQEHLQKVRELVVAERGAVASETPVQATTHSS